MAENAYVPPYISAGEFDKFIKSLRNRRPPDPLTVKRLQEIGISDSNSYTLKGSLVKMGVYDEEGKLLQRDELTSIASADENTRREAFESIVKRTYKELLEAIPIESATVAKVRHYFEKNHAAPGPALKAARLFIWLASQAGYQTAEVDFTPNSLNQEKHLRQKRNQRAHRADGSSKRGADNAAVPYLATPADYEEKLLNIMLEKINATHGLPSAEILQQVRELIESQDAKKKARQANETPKPDPVKES